jgi:hypothetical protein
LIALVGVPAGANHTCRKSTSVVVDDFTHNCSSRLNWGQSSQLLRLVVNVVPDILGNAAGVRWGAWSLAVDSVVDGLQLVWASVSDVHRLYILG